MTSTVQKFDGTVDKFIGDSVFAIFNAPLDVEDHATKAVRCMLDMDRFTESFRKKMNEEGIPLGVTRIGVNTGIAAVGNFGSQRPLQLHRLGRCGERRLAAGGSQQALRHTAMCRPRCAYAMQGRHVPADRVR